jgi:hypothetical protein
LPTPIAGGAFYRNSLFWYFLSSPTSHWHGRIATKHPVISTTNTISYVSYQICKAWITLKYLWRIRALPLGILEPSFFRFSPYLISLWAKAPLRQQVPGHFCGYTTNIDHIQSSWLTSDNFRPSKCRHQRFHLNI